MAFFLIWRAVLVIAAAELTRQADPDSSFS
jgi:hypothetical protein